MDEALRSKALEYVRATHHHKEQLDALRAAQAAVDSSNALLDVVANELVKIIDTKAETLVYLCADADRPGVHSVIVRVRPDYTGQIACTVLPVVD
jgi:hypothetical protein